MQLNFVLCPSYHGATLLAVLLANHSRIISLGDAIPSREFIQRCSCGMAVDGCDFWTALLDRLHPQGAGVGGELAERIEAAFPVFTATRMDQAFSMLGLALGNRVWVLSPARREYADRYVRFWDEVRRMTGADMAVDGEKSVTKVALLASLFGRKADVRVIHLVRDPRAFLHSCRTHMQDVSLEQAAAMWNHHANMARLAHPFFRCRYHRLRHEELCADPDARMAEVFAFLGAQNEEVARKPDDPAKYHMMGNKMLMSFDGTVRLDESWREAMSEQDQRRILEMTAPLSAACGYC